MSLYEYCTTGRNLVHLGTRRIENVLGVEDVRSILVPLLSNWSNI